MINRLKALGLAAVAVFAMSAVVATAAQAQFTASSYPKSATAESAKGNDTFTTEAGTIECKVHYAFGSLSGPSTTITVTPTYSECTAFGFALTVNMNGCDYVIHDAANNHQNQFTINCPAGKSIQRTAGPCEITIPGQGPLGNVIMTTAGNHINMQFNLSGIAYNVVKDGFLCPLNGTGAKTGATRTHHNALTVVPIGGGSISVD